MGFVIAIGICLTIGACGQAEANNYNLPNNNIKNVRPVPVRIWFPHEYATVIRECVNGDGIYVGNSEGSGGAPMFVVKDDGACK